MRADVDGDGDPKWGQTQTETGIQDEGRRRRRRGSKMGADVDGDWSGRGYLGQQTKADVGLRRIQRL